MGAMMWLMMRPGAKHQQPATDPAGRDQEIAALRAEIQDLRATQDRTPADESSHSTILGSTR